MQLVVGINHTHWLSQIGCADCSAIVSSHSKGIGLLIYGHCVQHMGAVAEVQCAEGTIERHDQRIFHHSYLSEINCATSNGVFAKYRPIPLHVALAVVADNGTALTGRASGFVHLSAFNRYTVSASEG